MEKLSMILWRERGLQETLLFHLEVEQLVLASGRTRWLMRAATDIEGILEQVRRVEIARAVLTDEVAETLGLRPNAALNAIIEAATEPWATILSEHRDALVATTREIADLADANRDLITAGHRSARETLMTLSDPVGGYTPDGGAVSSRGDGPRRLDLAF